MRVSTDEQADSRAGLEAQRAAIETECRRRGWRLASVQEDAGVSGKATTNRPALTRTLDSLSAGEADVLVVAKLDRLSQSTFASEEAAEGIQAFREKRPPAWATGHEVSGWPRPGRWRGRSS